VAVAALDPFRGYASALRAQLPAAVRVLDAFHVVGLGFDAVDQVRRRVQQETLGHRGRAGDPLYGICECRCGAPEGRTTRLGVGDRDVTRTASGRLRVPSGGPVRRGCRRRPGPPAGLIRSLSAFGVTPHRYAAR
jgi:hypothetical protein